MGHLYACGRLDCECLEASQIDILRWLNLLHQNGLAPLKPQGSKEEARHGIAWAPTFIKRIFPGARRYIMHNYSASQRVEPIETGREPRPARRRKSGEAKERPSHIGITGLRNDPLQRFKRNTGNRQIRCNQGKQLSASQRCKFEHWYSNTISSILQCETHKPNYHNQSRQQPPHKRTRKHKLAL